MGRVSEASGEFQVGKCGGCVDKESGGDHFADHCGQYVAVGYFLDESGTAGG